MSTNPIDRIDADEVLLKVFSLPYKMAACASLQPVLHKYGGCVSEIHANGKHGMNAILSFPSTAASQMNKIIQQVKHIIPTPEGGKCVGVEKLPHSYKADPARKKADASRRRSRLLMFPVFVTKNGSRTMVKPDYLLQLKLAFAIRDEIAETYVIEPDVCQVKYAEKHNAQLEVMLQFATPTEALMVRQRQLIDGTEKKIGSFVMYCHTGQQYQKRAFYAPSLPTRPNAFARKDSPSSNPSNPPGLQKGATENFDLDEDLSLSNEAMYKDDALEGQWDPMQHMPNPQMPMNPMFMPGFPSMYTPPFPGMPLPQNMGMDMMDAQNMMHMQSMMEAQNMMHMQNMMAQGMILPDMMNPLGMMSPQDMMAAQDMDVQDSQIAEDIATSPPQDISTSPPDVAISPPLDVAASPQDVVSTTIPDDNMLLAHLLAGQPDLDAADGEDSEDEDSEMITFLPGRGFEDMPHLLEGQSAPKVEKKSSTADEADDDEVQRTLLSLLVAE